ncbi:predicted protein [Thalassiosira pseudonana CCMP1335]|uniref:Elongator complex protein 5 n=1 Tax=Thalassiosira pseudonana TaxID=35128 RepID=B5YLR7_THAPS|nr:predicted protein [Thalassiosira pseudonana CCMP1335]ACI64125.1 predicted protein [Thalassiosira pseudonana CCMP1335]
MSHSSGSGSITSSTQPLSDVLQWGSPISIVTSSSLTKTPSSYHPSSTSSDTSVTRTHQQEADDTACKAQSRTVLITDSVSTDGRFLLHTLALQFLSSRHSCSSSTANVSGGGTPSVLTATTTTNLEGAVLWISCAPTSEKQVMISLRKGMQHNLGATSTSRGEDSMGKIGVGSGSTSTSSSTASAGGWGKVHIVSIPLELTDAALSDEAFSQEAYLKQLHERVRNWLNHREFLSLEQHLERKGERAMQQQEQQQQRIQSTMGPNLIVIDNLTTLGTLFGDALANVFVASVGALLRNHARNCSVKTNAFAAASTSTSNNNPTNIITSTNLLAIRCTSPDDGGLYQVGLDEDNMHKGEMIRSEYSRVLRPWLGMGSSSGSAGTDGTNGNAILQIEEQSSYLSVSSNSSPSILYKSGLHELADGIVDVSPLESGYARDVLGRLSFATTWSGRGWWGAAGISPGKNAASGGNAKRKEEGVANGSAYSSICVNYRCDDSGVRIMRLRSR